MAAITQTCWGPKHYDQSMETHTGVQQLNTNERTEKFQKPVLETMFLQSNPFQVLLGGPEVFTGQMRCIISLKGPGSLPSLVCLENLQKEAPKYLTYGGISLGPLVFRSLFFWTFTKSHDQRLGVELSLYPLSKH